VGEDVAVFNKVHSAVTPARRVLCDIIEIVGLGDNSFWPRCDAPREPRAHFRNGSWQGEMQTRTNRPRNSRSPLSVVQFFIAHFPWLENSLLNESSSSCARSRFEASRRRIAASTRSFLDILRLSWKHGDASAFLLKIQAPRLQDFEKFACCFLAGCSSRGSIGGGERGRMVVDGSDLISVFILGILLAVASCPC